MKLSDLYLHDNADSNSSTTELQNDEESKLLTTTG